MSPVRCYVLKTLCVSWCIKTSITLNLEFKISVLIFETFPNRYLKQSGCLCSSTVRVLRYWNLQRFVSIPKFPYSVDNVCLFSTRHCSLLRLIVRSLVRLSNFPHARAPSGGKVKLWARNVREFCLNADLHFTFRDLLHAVKLRHGTDGFTSPPKEGVQRIFFCTKNPTASAGCEPANLGTRGQHATCRPPKPLC